LEFLLEHLLWYAIEFLIDAIGQCLKQAFTRKGINFYLNTQVTAIKRKNNLYSIALDNHQQITADMVLSAIGIEPNVKLAKEAGINTAYGIITNQYLQTNFTNIFAIGDCAKVCGFNHQYIAPIRHCTHALAKTLAGNQTKVYYPAMPIGVKTPIYPVVVCQPIDKEGKWEINIDENDNAEALHYDDDRILNGFILTKKNVKKRMDLESSLSPWLQV